MSTRFPRLFTSRNSLTGLALAAGIALPVMLGPVSGAHAAATTERIPVVVLTALIQDAFRGTQIRLNGYNSLRQGGVENDSFITLGPQLGGATQRFTLNPAFRRGKPHHFYVSDINLRRITVGQSRQFIRVTFHFEESGVELKGICRGSRVECPLGRDNTTPDVQISNFRVDVLLEPWAVDGGLSYRRAIVRLVGEPQANGICRVGTDVCDALTNYKRTIRQTTEHTIQTFLQRPELRRRLAEATRPTLRGRGIGNVFFVQIRGSTLEIYHRS